MSLVLSCLKSYGQNTDEGDRPSIGYMQDFEARYPGIKNMNLKNAQLNPVGEVEKRLVTEISKYKNNDNFALLYAELLNSQNNFSILENLLNSRKSYEKNEFEQCCYYYARIFESKGDYLKAIDIARKGLGFVNCYTERYYTLLYNLYKNIGDSTHAIDCLEKAANINPDLRPALIKENASL